MKYCEKCLQEGIKVGTAYNYMDMELCPFHYYKKKGLNKYQLPEGEILNYAKHHPKYTGKLRDQYQEFDELLREIKEDR